MIKIEHQPRLWFTSEDVERIKNLLAEEVPTAVALSELAMETASGSVDEWLAQATDASGSDKTKGDHVYDQSLAMAYLLTGEQEYARKAYEFQRVFSRQPKANLGRASQAYRLAIVHEACYGGWNDQQRREMTGRLVELHRSFYDASRGGDPHNVTNNHWAVSHAGAAMAAMAAQGHPGPDGDPVDLSEGIAWAMGRMKAFCMHFGDAGIYHEGLGYMKYATTFMIPALLAWRNFGGEDLLATFPHLRDMPASLYIPAAARRAVPDVVGGEGNFAAELSWNDSGPSWGASSVIPLLFSIAPTHQRGALRWMYDRLKGIHGDGSFTPQWGGWVMALFHYPFDAEPTPPDGVLPRHITDSRQGLGLLRNRYADGNDTILGCYAKNTHIGGHVQDDTGSVRFMSLGCDWIMGGGQARAAAEYQSVVIPADGSRDKNRLGAVVWDEASETGGVFGMDLRKSSVGYAERYLGIDWSDELPAEAAIAWLDNLDDHDGRDWLWNMTYQPGLDFQTHDDGAGFTLRAENGASLNARFLAAVPAEMRQLETPVSARRFQSGAEVSYVPRPYVQAVFPAQKPLAIYVVLTVQN
ncbi:MAG: hypothetical protein ACOC93_05060, partial [Planctomycetota bacterium]